MRLQAVLSALVMAALDLAFVLAAARIAYVLAARALGRAAAVRGGALAESSRRIRVRTRNVLIITCVLLAIVILASNAWLASRGMGAWTYTVSLGTGIAADTWIRAAFALSKLAAAVLGFLVAVRLLRRLFRAVEEIIAPRELLREHHEALRSAFRGLDQVVANTGWLLLVLFAFYLFAVPAMVVGGLVTILEGIRDGGGRRGRGVRRRPEARLRHPARSGGAHAVRESGRAGRYGHRRAAPVRWKG